MLRKSQKCVVREINISVRRSERWNHILFIRKTKVEIPFISNISRKSLFPHGCLLCTNPPYFFCVVGNKLPEESCSQLLAYQMSSPYEVLIITNKKVTIYTLKDKQKFVSGSFQYLRINIKSLSFMFRIAAFSFFCSLQKETESCRNCSSVNGNLNYFKF